MELCRTDVNRCKIKKWKDRPKIKEVADWEKARVSFALQCHLRNKYCRKSLFSRCPRRYSEHISLEHMSRAVSGAKAVSSVSESANCLF